MGNIEIYKILGPEIFLGITTIGLLILGLEKFIGRNVLNKIESRQSREISEGWRMKDILRIGIVLLMITLGLIYISGEGELFGGSVINNEYTKVIKIVSLLGIIGVLGLSRGYIENKRIDRYEYVILVLFIGWGLLLLIGAGDFIVWYLALEIISLSSYIIAAFKIKNSYSLEAGLKYFVLGALATGIGLYGISRIYGSVGTINFKEVGEIMSINGIDEMNLWVMGQGIVFIIIGFGFKMAAAPLHSWAVDVYEGAPKMVSVLFMTVPKIGILSVMLRVLFVSFEAVDEIIRIVLMILGIVSVIWGTVCALRQEKIKRFLAYSTVGHIGYIMFGLSMGSRVGVESVLIYMIIYMITSLNIWGVVMLGGGEMNYIVGLRGLWKRNSLLGGIVVVNVLSMVGLPPFAGFFAKLGIIKAAIERGGIYIIIAIILVLIGVIGGYYYLRIIKIAIFEPSMERIEIMTGEGGIGIMIVLATTFMGIACWGMNPWWISGIIEKISWLCI